jgi:hypothetical protein
MRHLLAVLLNRGKKMRNIETRAEPEKFLDVWVGGNDGSVLCAGFHALHFAKEEAEGTNPMGNWDTPHLERKFGLQGLTSLIDEISPLS